MDDKYDRVDWKEISDKKQIRVPKVVMERLDLEPGDGIDFLENSDNDLVIKRLDI